MTIVARFSVVRAPKGAGSGSPTQTRSESYFEILFKTLNEILETYPPGKLIDTPSIKTKDITTQFLSLNEIS